MNIYCKRHPKYEAKRQPRKLNDCSKCWEIWNDSPHNPTSKNYLNFQEYKKELNKLILKDYKL